MTKPKHKYTMTKVTIDGDGWKYEASFNQWLIFHDGESHYAFRTDLFTVMNNYVLYNWHRMTNK